MNSLAVYTEGGIFVATKTGAITGPAQFDLVVRDLGLFSPHTVQSYNTLHFLLGTDNAEVFNGIQLTAIEQGIRSTIFTLLNPLASLRNFSILNYETQEYALFVATGGNVTADTAWVYNWARNVAYPWKFPFVTLTAATVHHLIFSPTIAQLVGQIGAQTWTIGAQLASQTFPNILLGCSDGHIVQLSNIFLGDRGETEIKPINCRWTSKDYTARDVGEEFAAHQVTINKIGVTYVDNGAPCTLQFSFSTNRGVSWQGPYPLTMGGVVNGAVDDKQLTQQVTGKRVRFKIENNTLNELPQIVAFYPELELRKQTIA
jgi:hypothetical protein